MTPADRVKTLGVLLLVAVTASLPAGEPSFDRLVPDTTVGFLSVPDMSDLVARWKRTELGILANEESMTPAIDEFDRVIRKRLERQGFRLGLELNDFRDVAGGEVALAAIQPGGSAIAHAFAVLVDVTGHEEQAKALLKKVEERLVQDKVTKASEQIEGADVDVYSFPRRAGEPQAFKIFVTMHGNRLLALDHREEFQAVLKRLKGDESPSLHGLDVYQNSMKPAVVEAEPDHLRWFMRPFGLARVLRTASHHQIKRKESGIDILAAFEQQGFDAIQGVGGTLQLATNEHDLLYRSFVFAPATGMGDNKYQLAANMLDFPNQPGMAPEPWIPKAVDNFSTMNWNLPKAFLASSTLVDNLAEDEGYFDALMDSIKNDNQGPMIDLKALVKKLGQNVLMLTDHEAPLSPKSQRWALALRLQDAKAIEEALNKAMKRDPDARKHAFGDRVIWVIENNTETFSTKSNGEKPRPRNRFGGEDPVADERRLPDMAMCVANSWLIVGSRVAVVEKLLKDGGDSLAKSEDYQAIDQALVKLGSAEDSARWFLRTADAVEVDYELLRQGKMAESETVLGKLLNTWLGPKEEGVQRKQQVDGTKLPPLGNFREHLLPLGAFIRAEADGWYICGCAPRKAEAQ